MSDKSDAPPPAPTPPLAELVVTLRRERDEWHVRFAEAELAHADTVKMLHGEHDAHMECHDRAAKAERELAGEPVAHRYPDDTEFAFSIKGAIAEIIRLRSSLAAAREGMPPMPIIYPHVANVKNLAGWDNKWCDAVAKHDYDDLRAHATRLQAENRRLTVMTTNSLANNLCPDHRDKQAGKPCLACEIERLNRRVRAGEER